MPALWQTVTCLRWWFIAYSNANRAMRMLAPAVMIFRFSTTPSTTCAQQAQPRGRDNKAGRQTATVPGPTHLVLESTVLPFRVFTDCNNVYTRVRRRCTEQCARRPHVRVQVQAFAKLLVEGYVAHTFGCVVGTCKRRVVDPARVVRQVDTARTTRTRTATSCGARQATHPSDRRRFAGWMLSPRAESPSPRPLVVVQTHQPPPTRQASLPLQTPASLRQRSRDRCRHPEAGSQRAPGWLQVRNYSAVPTNTPITWALRTN